MQRVPNRSHPMNSRAIPTFWHDPALPWLEARAIDDGRAVRYGKHAHDTFSIGLVTGGESIYVNGKSREHVRAGAVVLMNPGDVHACNPLGDTPWAYRMFYVDSRWLAGVQRDVGLHRHDDLQPYVAIVSHAPALSAGLAALYATCTGRHADPLAKQQAAVAFSLACTTCCSPLCSRLPPRATSRARRCAVRPNTSPTIACTRSRWTTSARPPGCRRHT